MGPPEGVVLEEVELLKVRTNTPSLVISKRVTILLEEGVDTGDPPIPCILEVLQSQASILGHCLLSLHGVVSPNALTINELALPGLDVAEQVGDEQVLLVGKPRAKVTDANVRLSGEAKIGLGDEDVTHGEHAETTEFLGGVKDDGRETTGHLGVETHLDPRLHPILALDDQIQEFTRLNDSLPIISHQANEGGVPFVDGLGEGGSTGCHQESTNAISKASHGFLGDTQKGLCSSLPRRLIDQIPYSITEGEALLGTNLREDADLEAAEGEQKVGIITTIHGCKCINPFNCGDGTGETVLHVPKDGTTKVDVMLHETHATVSGPTLFVIVTDDVFVVGIWMLREVALD